MWNLFTVVDENDNIIWYKAKKDIDPVNEYYRVSALRLTNSQWDILIAQRAFDKLRNPGKRWPAVAGTVEQGETYEKNIIKEIEEEIWITGLQVRRWPRIKRESSTKYFSQRFFATIDKDISEFKIQEEEVIALKRISPEKLWKDIESHPENYSSNMKEYLTEFIK